MESRDTRTPAGLPTDRMGQVVVASGINLILGLWLIIAPFVLGFSGYRHSEWNCIVVGVIVATLAAIRIWGGRAASWLSWINAALGLWLIVSPWIYNNSNVNAILWNDIIVGAIIVVLGAWSALATEMLAR
jgi:hypothetical protein